MRKSLTIFAVIVLLAGGGYVYSSVYDQEKPKDAFCHIHKSNHSAKSVSAFTVLNLNQDQNQDPEQENPPSHNYSAGSGCSAKNPNAEPGTELDGVDPNTVGCPCVRKCVNGKTEEDLSRGPDGKYICSNACHKDRCNCPDLCKKT